MKEVLCFIGITIILTGALYAPFLLWDLHKNSLEKPTILNIIMLISLVMPVSYFICGYIYQWNEPNKIIEYLVLVIDPFILLWACLVDLMIKIDESEESEQEKENQPFS